jgi:hypothetical protein
LNPSDRSENFQEFCNNLISDAKQFLPKGQHTQIFLEIKDIDRLETARDRKNFCAFLKKYVDGQSFDQQFGSKEENLDITIQMQTAPLPNNFHPDRVSLTCMFFCQHHVSEQKRFHDKFSKAVENMKKNCRVVDENIGNLILCRITEAIQLNDASNYLYEYWKLYNIPFISGALLYRTSIASNESFQNSRIVYEFAVSENPNSDFSVNYYSGDAINIEIPIGEISFEPTKSILRLGEITLEIKEKYFKYISENHIVAYHIDNEETRVDLEVYPNINSTITFIVNDQPLEIKPHSFKNLLLL